MHRLPHRLVAAWWPGAVAAAFALPLVSMLRHADTGWVLKVVVIGLAAIAAAVPVRAVMLVAALLPLALALEALVAPAVPAAAITDAVVLAFVAGAAWRLARPVPDRPDRLSAPAILLAAIVAGAALADVGLGDGELLWRGLTGAYLVEPYPNRAVPLAIRWIALLALAVFTERAIRRHPEDATALVRIWFAGGVAAASFAVLRVTEVALTGRVGAGFWASLRQIFQQFRISALHPDLNAAGSYFAVFLTAVVVLAVWHRRLGLALLAGPPVLVAFVLAGSRAAFLAVAVVLAAVTLLDLVRGGRRWLVVVAGLAVAGLTAITLVRATPGLTHVDAGVAWAFRVEMLKVGLAMVREHPLAGAGLGQFVAASRAHITEDTPLALAAAPAGENAHNNYLQIAGELGLPALGAFLWLIASVWLPGGGEGSRSPAPAERRALGAGLAAFLVSALAGHPLLIPQVAAAFFLALGLAAALAPERSASRLARGCAWVGAGFVALSLFWRV